MGQIARLSQQVAVLNSKVDRLTAEQKPTIRPVFSPGLKKRDAADLFSPAASHGSSAKAHQRRTLGSDALFSKVLKGNPEFNPDQPRDRQGPKRSRRG